MKKIILILTVIFMPFLSFSQIFSGGILLGISGNQIDGDESAGYKKAGLLAGGFVAANISEKTSLIFELYYMGKGSVKNSEQSGGNVSPIFKTNLHYVEFPFLFSFDAIKKLSLSAGISPAYLIKAKLFSYGDEIPEHNYTMNNFDTSITGQIDFNFSEKFSFNVRYNRSVINIRKDDSWYNNNIAISLKYKIN